MTNRVFHATACRMRVDSLSSVTSVVRPPHPVGKDPCLIRKVRDQFGWLGNMSPHPIQTPGHLWHTAEALFQACRFMPDSEIRRLLKAEKNPMKAKMLAKASKEPRQVEPLSDEDTDNMLHVITLKHRQHASVRAVLASTGTKCIIEDVSNRRNRGSAMFWGMAKNEDGSWEGQNWLGRLWMYVRETESVTA